MISREWHSDARFSGSAMLGSALAAMRGGDERRCASLMVEGEVKASGFELLRRRRLVPHDDVNLILWCRLYRCPVLFLICRMG